MYDPQQFVAKHVAGLPRSGIRDFFAIVSQMKDAISLGIGEPDFITPWHIREAAIYALERGKTSYTDNRGLLKLRQVLADYIGKNFGMGYKPENEILVTVGVSEALDIALRAVINPGDKVLYHEPCYVSYHPSVSLVHGQAIPIATSAADDFALDPDKVIEAWEPGVKVLILNFPTNPTGGVTDRTKLEKLAKFVIEKDILVISDEVYAELTYEGTHTSIASLPGMQERTIFLHGFSKAWAMTGFRLGFACGPAPLVEAMMKVHQYAMMCAPILSQEAGVEAIVNGAQSVAKMKEQYQRRRDYITRRFNEIGLKCHVPKGTFYAFPALPKGFQGKSMDFCQGLLNAEKVAVVPGTAFGPSGEGFFRASFSNSYEQLIAATEAIERYVGSLKL
ncbi:aminotransferase class I/II-fold pyridoxal phosphate-dependent enzyme [Ruficoccus sp. ZRK36]|uniref:aminotransferase class I/II-fold pyridoxal phosphate-dependent enzyme n=1 Tax=Ruficoccus sp. ZRK36 TaxID=2866311 RepID=UPI001C735933|nr:aminotransferase class I/II-fold pyridoxal phosphate-dependent enzyme [Ruficoccus sp. ZRK36]QYY34715.1 aminotransferase class I/II-fold pyridoxal phosphate-dependent enzyme [Ruficoccus sp. ZRK36]